jgi:hypothetical protein
MTHLAAKEKISFRASWLTDAVSQLLLSMMGAVYQFERNIMPERQRERIAIAKANVNYKGFPKSVDCSAILALLDDGLSMRKTAGKLGVSLSTVQRVKCPVSLQTILNVSSPIVPGTIGKGSPVGKSVLLIVPSGKYAILFKITIIRVPQSNLTRCFSSRDFWVLSRELSCLSQNVTWFPIRWIVSAS